MRTGSGGASFDHATPGAPGEGGAIWSSGALAATNSTWATNQADGGPCGLALIPGAGGPGSGGAVLFSAGREVLVNVTVAANAANGGSGTPLGLSQGGGLYNTNGDVTLLNSIIADSLSGGDVWGPVTDAGYNICSDGTAGFSAASSYNQTNPMLGPLTDNGGPTLTMALLSGSPALDAIPSGFPPVDQRGVPRPQGPSADLGAFEAIATNSGPIILTQPQAGTVPLGTNVTLSVAALAAGPLAYQWFKDGAAIAGATNSSLFLTNIQATSAGAYWSEVSSAGIQVSSQTAVLAVDSAPVFVSSPTNLVVSVGATASLAVVAQGPGLIYSWWHNGSVIPGATNATLVIESAQAGAQGTYQVGVSNSAGSALSPDFRLSFDASGLGVLAPPPSSVTANAGDLVTLTGLVGGIAPITYQWQADGTNLPGATNSTLTFTAPALPGTYLYTLGVASAYGKFSEPVELEVDSGYYWSTLAGLAGAVGSADGTGSAARFNEPPGVAVDGLGNVYVADSANETIRRVTSGGVVTTLAGLAGAPGSVDGVGSMARFSAPTGVAVDSTGNVYVGDMGNAVIRKVTPAGVVTTLAGLAGNPGSADGTGSTARFDHPAGVAVDSAGNVYVADYWNYTIRKITPEGVVTTLAGEAGVGGNTDGTGSAALFYGPFGVAVDAADNIYVADQFFDIIRKITPTGVVTTLAGAWTPGSADGTGSAARFNQPVGVAVDSAGNVYVADQANETVRQITPAGAVTTLAGLAGVAGSADGMRSAARFNTPSGVAVDSAGNLYVADTLNDRIVVGVPPSPSPSVALVAGIYWMRTLPNQPNSLAVATLAQACTAPAGDALTITSVGPSSSRGGTAQLSGSTITYTPPAGFVGLDSFSYSITDHRGAPTQGTVIVAVSALPGGLASPVDINLPLPNSVVLRFAGVPGIAYHVEASSDLVHWTEIGAASAVTNGWFEFIDSETRLSSARFYRIRVP